MAKFQVEQYFHVSLSLLKLGRALPFTLHIYLPVNDRIVPLILSGEVYGQRTADLLASRKISEVYILATDRAAYEEYMQAEGLTPDPMAVGVRAQDAPEDTPQGTPPEAVHAPQGSQTTPTDAPQEEPKTLQELKDSSAARKTPTEFLSPTEVVATGIEPPIKGSVTAKDEAGPSPAEQSGSETVGPIEVVATGHTSPEENTPPEAANAQPETQNAEPDASQDALAGQITPATPAASTEATPPKPMEDAPVPVPVSPPAPEAASQDIAAQPARAQHTSQQSSRKLASKIFGNDSGASEQALSTSRKIIRKLLEGASDEEKKLFDVFAALNAAGQQGYSSSVASYCVLFAMGIGYSDVETLRDLAVASLLHDIGTTQLPPGTVWTPRNQQTPAQRREFVEHVRLGKNLLESLGFKPNARVAALIEAHHEKFDGTGYPKGIRGEKLTELSQVLSFSDFLHSLSTGYFDGKKRSPHESFAYLREIENDPLFPHYFNPNLFRKIVDWVDAGSSSGPPLAAAS